MTASPCSALTRQDEAMTMASPLRGTESPEGGRLRRRSPSRRGRAGYGAAPPASSVLRIALRATALRAALDPGDHCGPWEQEQRAGPGLPPTRAATQTRRWPGMCKPPNPEETDELASGTQKAENHRYHSQALESVKHHLKPNRQRSVGPRQGGSPSPRTSWTAAFSSSRLQKNSSLRATSDGLSVRWASVASSGQSAQFSWPARQCPTPRADRRLRSAPGCAPSSVKSSPGSSPSTTPKQWCASASRSATHARNGSSPTAAPSPSTEPLTGLRPTTHNRQGPHPDRIRHRS